MPKCWGFRGMRRPRRSIGKTTQGYRGNPRGSWDSRATGARNSLFDCSLRREAATDSCRNREKGPKSVTLWSPIGPACRGKASDSSGNGTSSRLSVRCSVKDGVARIANGRQINASSRRIAEQDAAYRLDVARSVLSNCNKLCHSYGPDHSLVASIIEVQCDGIL